MPKIVYQICCGVDVHRDFVFACILTTDECGVTRKRDKRFGTSGPELQKFLNWLLENNCRDVCMESTGKYWFGIYRKLESHVNVVVTHPKYVKAIKGKKTDKKDAEWIADLFKHDLVRGSFIPPADIRQLRDLARYLTKLTNMNSSEKNRLINCLTVSDIRLDQVFADVLGKTSSSIIDCLLSNPSEKLLMCPAFEQNA